MRRGVNMNNQTRTNSRSARYIHLLWSIVTAVLLAFTFMTAPAIAFDKGEYKAPKLEGYAITSEEDGDGDGDSVNETHIRHYMNMTGDRVFSMTTKGKLWAWSSESINGVEPEKNYVIRDSDCDGVFDERYGLDDEFHLPDCVK